MTSLDEFLTEQGAWGPRCSVALVLDALPPEEAAKLRLALATPAIQHIAIARWARKRDVRLSAGSVARHRLRECRCPAD